MSRDQKKRLAHRGSVVAMRSAVTAALTVSLTAHGAPALEEVLVTAQKRSQSAQDIPVAVTGLGGDQLDKLGFENANDVSAQVPNMQVSGPYGDVQPIFSIRGVSMSDYSSNQASPIGVYVDEAYLGPVYSHGANFFDVERLEVLRGPQGTLYGKNTTGGAINIITRTPGFDEPASGFLKLGAGSYNATTVEAAAESELIPGVLAGRLAGSIKKNDGYVEVRGKDENAAQTDFKGARLALNWRINDAWDAVLKYTTSNNDAISTPPRNEPRTDLRGTGLEGDSNGFIDYTGYSRPSRGLDFHESEVNNAGALVTNTDLAVLTVNYNADNYSLTSVSSYLDADYYQKADTDGSPNGLLEITWASDSISYSQDLRFTSNFDGMFNIIAGVFYGQEDLYMNNIYDIFNQIPDLRVGLAKPDTIPIFPYLIDFGKLDQRLATEKSSAAVYSQMRFDFSANFGMDIGLRYTQDKNTLSYLNISRLANDGTPRGSYVPGNTTGVDNAWITLPLTVSDIQSLLQNPLELLQITQTGYTHGPYTLDSAPELDTTEREWTGKVGLDYRLSDELMVYASASRGYRSGSFNGGAYYIERPLETAYASPEYIDAFEVGFKADLFDNSMRLNAAAFHYDYTNQQFINVVGISNFLENAGGSTIQGLEAELWARVTERLTLQLGAGYLDTEYTELTLANTETIANEDDTVDLSGNELISAPKFNFSISADYDVLVTQHGYLSVNVNANFQDDQWYSAYNDDYGYGEIRQDAYWLYNGRISWYANDDSYSISVWGKNLADEEYDSYAINLQAGFGFDQYLAGEPRSYGAELMVRF
ncbi:TonB-dependent receptor [Spongiibacter marinus]|uniref:TonB-dependent receptor n=1 Tax=Spongiibacter marinus TaxID=354246 RepID=UPI0004010BB6|nr:TonB-dependent receptor [Spongiibacter marinus]